MPKNADRQRANQLGWMKRRRAQWIRENGPCAHCGSTEQLEVDHIDPSGKLTHRVWSWSKPRRDAELVKCQVLCRDCHKAKTRVEHSARMKARFAAGYRIPKRQPDPNSIASRIRRGEANHGEYLRRRRVDA